MALTLADVKRRRNDARPRIDIPEWGDEPFYVAPISTATAFEVLKVQRQLCPDVPLDADEATQEAAFQAALIDRAETLVEFYVKLISRSLANAAGVLLFDSYDGRDFIRAEAMTILKRVAEQVQRLNGFDPAENPGKNSQATPSDCSSSSSGRISESGTSSD